MGKGDQRSRRGKLSRGTHGKRRPKNRELAGGAALKKPTAPRSKPRASAARTAATGGGAAGTAGTGGAAGGSSGGGGTTA